MIPVKVLIHSVFILITCVYLTGCGLDNVQKNPVSVSGKQVDIEDENAFTILETDIVQMDNSFENLEVMEQFVADSTKGLESEIRYVIFESDNTDPTAVYTLKSRVDSEAKQNWVEISRDWKYDTEGQILIEPQQCSNVTKDTERGAYYFNECFHQWEIELMPI